MKPHPSHDLAAALTLTAKVAAAGRSGAFAVARRAQEFGPRAVEAEARPAWSCICILSERLGRSVVFGSSGGAAVLCNEGEGGPQPLEGPTIITIIKWP